MDKVELSKILSTILNEYGFLDEINIKSYEINSKQKNVYGIFKESNLEYNFSLNYDNKLNVTHLSWIQLNAN